MAFATLNPLYGTAGPFKFYAAAWTGDAGDASGTITLGGGEVWFISVQNQDADNPKESVVSDVSISGSTITVTVHNHQTVTRGRLFIIYS